MCVCVSVCVRVSVCGCLCVYVGGWKPANDKRPKGSLGSHLKAVSLLHERCQQMAECLCT